MTRIGAQRETKGIGAASLGQLVRQGGQCVPLGVIVDALQQQDVGVEMRDDGDDSVDLVILTAQDIAQQQAGAVAGQFRLVGGDADGIGDQRAGQQKEQQQPDQTGCKPPCISICRVR